MSCITILLLNNVNAKTYRWVDNKGVVHYSERIPPSQVQFGHKQLDEKNGTTIKEVESSHQRIEKQEVAATKRKLVKERKKALREELIIYMFSSEEELKAYFEQKIKMISVNVRLLEYHKKKLSLDIKKVRKHLTETKNIKLKKKLVIGLADFKQSLLDHKQAIQTNHNERALVTDKMTRAIRAYRKNFASSTLAAGSLIGDTPYQRLRENNGKGMVNTTKACDCRCPTNKIAN